ncbi:hypothetical protein LCGC14_1165700 [marine sediment metagenome]|uniref:Uncharacterized protein n=1 Tax=marine sediment metagenome TaxID=412755 RepID=A0A0F9MEC2_9ZZZZ
MMCSNLCKIHGLTAKVISVASGCENEDRKTELLSLADEIILVIEKMSDEADCED